MSLTPQQWEEVGDRILTETEQCSSLGLCRLAELADRGPTMKDDSAAIDLFDSGSAFYWGCPQCRYSTPSERAENAEARAFGAYLIAAMRATGDA